MNILLNATSREIESIGGDFSLYRDWLRLSGGQIELSLVPDSPRRFVGGQVRKLFEKSCRTWQPPVFRRRLFLRSRLLPIERKEIGECDIVFSHLLFPQIIGSRKVPIIWSSQGISPPTYYERTHQGKWTVDDVRVIYGILGRRSDILLISTEFGAQAVKEVCPELAGKIRVIHGPVFSDEDRVPKPSEKDDEVRFLFVGLDADRKGLPEVISAFRRLKAEVEDIRLDIVSRPSDRIKREIEATRGAHLHLSSPRTDVKGLMGQSDVFLMPTYADTYALAAVEAMAHSCAVVISDLQPLPEIVPDGVAGFCVPAGDESSLLEKMRILRTQRELLRRQQHAAYGLYRERHHPTVVAMKLTAVFEEALAGFRSRGN